MTDWRSTVRGQAEQVVEHYGLSALDDEEAVDRLVDDPLFQELAIAQHRTDLAIRATGSREKPSGAHVEDDVREVEDDLLGLVRDRGREVLAWRGFDLDLDGDRVDEGGRSA
jgi:hypothetical protein